MSRKILLAVGGNSLQRKLSEQEKTEGAVQDLADQILTLRLTTDQLVKSIHECNVLNKNFSHKHINLIVTTGNGPQVGIIMQRSELSRHPVSKGGLGYPIDMDICGADTQGSIGHMFFVAYNDSLAKLSLSSMPQLVSVLTPVEVSRADPGFVRPTKPVGVGYDTEAEAKEAMKREAWDGYAFYPATNRWRRLVASPKPVKIGGIEAVKMLYESDKFLVVCGIGGGVPYSINPDRTIRREAAVIDKDLESAMMAVQLGIPEFYISTAIDFVKLDFGKPNERNLLSMSLQDLNKLLAEDALRSKKDKQFGEGAMEPKLQAVQYFLQNSVSKDAKAYITHVSNLHDALVNSKNCSVFGKHIETIIGSVVRK